MPQNKKNIVLLGMMGAGKTTVAKLLAEKLSGFRLVDLDEQIEKTANMKISEIFEKYGEAYFRDLETKVAKEVVKADGQIVSTGGGIVVREENLEILKQNGALFYLSAPAEVLYDRVKTETHRPLLMNENPLAVLSELLKNRESAYKTADYEIKTQNKELSKIVEEIVEKYGTKL